MTTDQLERLIDGLFAIERRLYGIEKAIDAFGNMVQDHLEDQALLDEISDSPGGEA